MPKRRKDVPFMYFFDGKLGAYERMMTQKPGFYRRSGKSGKPHPPKKPIDKKTTESKSPDQKEDNS